MVDTKKIITHAVYAYTLMVTLMCGTMVWSAAMSGTFGVGAQQDTEQASKKSSGDLTLMNLTGQQVYAGTYQYNYERGFNTKDGKVIVVEPNSTVTLAVPGLVCIAATTMFGKQTSCSSHSRIRLFVSTTRDNNVLQNQKGFLNSAILSIDPMLWYMQVRAQKTYVVFYNGFFFDPWSATAIKVAKMAKIDSLNQDDEAYLYPARLNIIEKDNKFTALQRYVEFQNWMTQG